MRELSFEELGIVGGGECNCVCVNYETKETISNTQANQVNCITACRAASPGIWDMQSCV